jgi:hypothetical protein
VYQDWILNLAAALRELHYYKRRLQRVEIFPQNEEHAVLVHQANELVPLWIDLTYVYLRRLADGFVRAASQLLFEQPGVLPDHFTGLQEWLNTGKAARARPIGDLAALEDAFRRHAEWVTLLRGRGSGAQKGTRDAILHRAVLTSVRYHKVENESQEMTVHLRSTSRDVNQSLELVSTIYEIVRGFCDLCTAVHTVIGWNSKYDPLDHPLRRCAPPDGKR